MKPIILIVAIWGALTWGYAEAHEFRILDSKEYVESNRWCNDSLDLGSITGSIHIDSDKEWNEDQWPSLYIQCNGWSVGFYENSYSNPKFTDRRLISWILGYEHDYYRYNNWTLSWTLGAVSGYPKTWEYKFDEDYQLKASVTETRWLPWASLNVQYRRVKVWLLPTMNAGRSKIKFPGVIGFGIEHRFW